VAAGFAYTQTKDGHISVELIVSKLPLRYQKVFYGFGNVICLLLYALITWQSFKGGQTQWRNSVTSGAFEIPLWPFYFFLSLGCAVFCLVFLSDILKLCRREVKSE
jgi:TRAP-type C4-dicarboxylate transport system permease small subunit